MTSSTPSIKLYYKRGACSQVPHALLHHLNVPFHGIPMIPDATGKYAAADGSFTHQDYLKLNPAGYVPALGLVDGTVITEMPAVLTHIVHLDLDSAHSSTTENIEPDSDKAAHLLGKTLVEKAQVMQWLAYLSGTLHSLGFAAQWRPKRFVGEHAESFEYVRQQGRIVIEKAFARIEEGLKGTGFLVGNELTVVDFNLYVFYRWGGRVGLDMVKRYENYTTAMKRVEELDAVLKMLEIEESEPCLGK